MSNHNRPTNAFARGNKMREGGNPYIDKLSTFRSKFVAKATPEEFQGLIDALWEMALAKDPWAMKEILQRLLGNWTMADVQDIPDTLIGKAEFDWSKLTAEEHRMVVNLMKKASKQEVEAAAPPADTQCQPQS